MLVAFLRFVGEWARNTGAVAFLFVLGDAMGLPFEHERPGMRLALVFGIALVGAAITALTRLTSTRVERPR